MTYTHPEAGTGSDWPSRLNPASMGPVRMDDPGEFIAALPAMLGFRPERSLAVAVLCAVDGEPGKTLVDLVVRFDLYHPETGHSSDAATVAAAARVCSRPEVVGILAVVIDETARIPKSESTQPHPVLDDLERRLTVAQVPTRAAWAVPTIAAGQPWWSLRGPQRSGYVLDPGTSIVEFGRALDGRSVGSRPRSEITALLAPDRVLHADVSIEFAGAAARAKERYTEVEKCGGQERYLRWQLDNVLRYVCDLKSCEQASARELAEIAAAVREHKVRDSLLALVDGPHAEAAEQLWAQLTRSVSGGHRAEAATLLGFFAYIRGDGTLAGIALDAALDADPLHSMAAMMHTALEAGMRPERLRDLARWAREAAAELGVTMPDAE